MYACKPNFLSREKKIKKGKKTNNNNNLKKYLKSEATEKNRQMGCWGKSR